MNEINRMMCLRWPLPSAFCERRGSWAIAIVTIFVISMPYANARLGVKLLERSLSGKTVVFGVGSMEGLKVGAKAEVLRKVRLPTGEIRHQFVGRGRALMVRYTNSTWVMDEVNKEMLEVEGRYLVATQEFTLRGRRPLNLKEREIVLENEEVSEEDFETGVDSDLVEENLEVADVLKKKQRLRFHPGDFTLPSWRRWDGDKVRKASTEIYNSPYKDDFVKLKRLETFEKQTANYQALPLRRPDANTVTIYDDMAPRLAERLAAEKDAESKAKQAELVALMEKGEDWSEDFTADELQARLKRLGIEYENLRRFELASERKSWAIDLGGGLNLLNNGARDSSIDSRSLALGFEYFLFHHFQSTNPWIRPGLEIKFRSSQDRLNAQGGGAEVTMYMGELMLNWYFVYNPNVLERNILFVSAGVSRGIANLVSVDPEFAQTGRYNAIGLPVLRAGLRYNFNHRHGMRFTVTGQTLNLSRVRRSPAEDPPVGVLGNSESFRELRGEITWSVLF